ncbi:hypothetical protein ACFQ3L_04770 [Lacticaseibacillus jixianensis]|uniref:Uncharacterized protein n=1 Tax=Lacticaseibacillus jixianensis TaxID=2486012 RepID=A0ABW4B7V8_9LACO|nr:hypothetical protein [Lacticaseibacillus jixianensis]
MDKRAINKFAVAARRQLIQGISLKLGSIGVTDEGVSEKLPSSSNNAEFYTNNAEPVVGKDIERRQQIVKNLRAAAQASDWQSAFSDFVEQTAYTWFNRIVAIRFMEVNDYLPSGVRVLSSIEGRAEPDIMVEARSLEESLGQYTTDERGLIEQAWNTQAPEDMDRLYRMLFLKQVNALSENLPKLFI